ncbi:MAG: hypothetical protein KC583_05060, partial [Myxococcales bacterium]|nr:hypothetical protein [Myxococcales bacterium]
MGTFAGVALGAPPSDSGRLEGSAGARLGSPHASNGRTKSHTASRWWRDLARLVILRIVRGVGTIRKHLHGFALAALCAAALMFWGCDDGAAAVDGAPGSDAARADASADARMPDARIPDARVVDAGGDAAPDGRVDHDAAATDDARVAPLDAAPDVVPDAERLDVGPPFRDAAPVDPTPPCTLFPCVCEPGEIEPCYAGPPGTAGVGICAEGSRVCAEDGQGFGPCGGAHRPPRFEDCRTPGIDEDCDGQTPPCTDTWMFAYAAEEAQAVRSVAVAPNGDVVVLLDFDETINLGDGPVTARAAKADLGVARYDSQGNPLWSRVFGDADNDFAAQVVVGPGGEVLVIGRVYGSVRIDGDFLDANGNDEILLIMLEADGAVRWYRMLGGPERDAAERAVIDTDGQVLLTGKFEDRVWFGPRAFDSAGRGDAFAAGLDGATGELIFARQAGGVGDDVGFGIARAADGGVYVAGRFEAILSWGGEPIESAGAGDVFLVSLGPDGTHRWTRRYGGPGEEGLHDLVRDPVTDTLLLFGWHEADAMFGDVVLPNAGSRDLFVVRLDADGE